MTGGNLKVQQGGSGYIRSKVNLQEATVRVLSEMIRRRLAYYGAAVPCSKSGRVHAVFLCTDAALLILTRV